MDAVELAKGKGIKGERGQKLAHHFAGRESQGASTSASFPPSSHTDGQTKVSRAFQLTLEHTNKGSIA